MGVVSSRAPTGASYPRQRTRPTLTPGSSSPPPLVVDSSTGTDAVQGLPSSLAGSRLRASERDLTPEQRIGRAAVRGTLIGAVAVTAIVTIIGLASHLDIVEAFGIGLFCAIWGGPGFGGMLGAIVAVTREQAREDAEGHPSRVTHDGD